jgi:hypothetical protein
VEQAASIQNRKKVSPPLTPQIEYRKASVRGKEREREREREKKRDLRRWLQQQMNHVLIERISESGRPASSSSRFFLSQ